MVPTLEEALSCFKSACRLCQELSCSAALLEGNACRLWHAALLGSFQLAVSQICIPILYISAGHDHIAMLSEASTVDAILSAWACQMLSMYLPPPASFAGQFGLVDWYLMIREHATNTLSLTNRLNKPRMV